MIEQTSKFIPLAIAAALVLGACQTTDQQTTQLPTLETASEESTSVTDPNEPASGDNDAEVDPELAMAEFEACMAEAGIELGTAEEEGEFVQSFEIEAGDAAPDAAEDIEAAFEQCNSILENSFGEFDISPEEQAELDDANLALTRCLAEAGFDVDFSDGGFTLDDTIDFAEFEAAMTSCAPDTEFGTVGGDQ